MPRDVPGYDLGREDLGEEEGEELEEEEEIAATTEEEEEEETDEMPPSGHLGRLILQNVNDMLHDHRQALHEQIDKQDEWHKKMYETLATMTSSLAHR